MRSETCPICDGQTTARPATIAPFLVERCGLETAETATRYCAACDFAFFDRRLTETETARLYKDYRGDDYNRQRLRLEPSYAAYIQMFADPLSDYYCRRIRDLAEVLASLPEVRPLTVLDFGGDGHIAARLFPASEISYLDASAGVVLKRDRFDLILASQVFEHLTDPRTEIARVAERLEDHGLLLLDVPREYPKPLSEALLWQERWGGSLTVMHEHINHFSTLAIQRLLATAGLVPVFEENSPHQSLILVIAGRPGSSIVQQLAKTAPERRLQRTMDGICVRQAAELAALVERLAAAEAARTVALEKLDILRASRSWRFTAPLRSVYGLWRGQAGSIACNLKYLGAWGRQG